MKIVSALLLLFAITAPSALQAQAHAGSDWTRVQQIDPGTMLHIASQHRPAICSFVSAEADSLTCTQTRSHFFIRATQTLHFTRQEITSIKLSRKPLSLLAGAAIGAGAGAGIGAAVDASSRSQEDPHLATALGVIFGGIAGSAVGSKLDFLAGPTLYRAP
ncbi:hypothetical protein [Granulicella sp. dw_53]|uniref:hypothetical protein n=1 Tax=Granulicella sp. dw_53 TaxID=2719792 RepID=UPI001BD63D88|nr:hypothetical protein [Granulicella sp. dw_53]